MSSFGSIAGLARPVLATVVACTLVWGSFADAAAGTTRRSRDRDTEDVFEANDLAEAVTEHMQAFWDDIFRRSDLPYETPYALLYDNDNYGETGCGEITDYGYSFYCVADDTVYVNIDQVADLRRQEGDLFASVMAVGQPLSMSVLDRVGALAFDRNGNADRASQEAAACLTGVWTAELWWADIVDEDDLVSAAEGLQDIGRTLPDAYLLGFETEEPQDCLDELIPEAL